MDNHIKNKLINKLTLVIFIVVANGCSSTNVRTVSAATSPGQPVITFPNSYDAQWSTAILSQPHATQAGVDGRTFAVSIMHGASMVQNNLMLDYDGDLGIRGVFKSVSTRKAKRDIRPYAGDALDTLRSLSISTFAYRDDPTSEPRHIGFIAEDAPVVLSGRNHDSFNLNNSVGLTMAATKQLDARVDRLMHRVSELERTISVLCGRHAKLENTCSK